MYLRRQVVWIFKADDVKSDINLSKFNVNLKNQTAVESSVVFLKLGKISFEIVDRRRLWTAVYPIRFSGAFRSGELKLSDVKN